MSELESIASIDSLSKEDLVDLNPKELNDDRNSLRLKNTVQSTGSFVSTDLQRSKTRQTILSVLSARASEQVNLVDNSDIENVKLQSSRTAEFFQESVHTQQLPTKQDGEEFRSIDPELVTWNGENDPRYPRNWPKPLRLFLTILLSSFTFIAQTTPSLGAIAMGNIDEEMNITNLSFSATIVSIFILSQGLAGLVVSPLSELYGRKIVMLCSLGTLLWSNLGCALTHNPYSFLVFRFFAGVGGAAPLSVGPGILADMFDDFERVKYFSIYNVGPTIAPTISPIIGGFMIKQCGWRYLFYLLIALDGFALLMCVLVYRESYSPVILHRDCKRLRKETGNPHLKTIYDIAEVNSSKSEIIWINIQRPVSLLIHHPMVYGLGVFMAFLFGCFYLLITSFPKAWGTKYGYSIQHQGLMYLCIGIPAMCAIFFWGWFAQKQYETLVKKNNGTGKPEFRIPSLFISGIVCPIGVLIYGWTIEKKTFWFVPCIGIGLYSFFYTGAFTFVTMYIVDMNPRYSASSNSALSLFRSVLGFVMPIFSPAMIQSIGYGWSNTIFFFVGAILGVPFPFYVYKYGEKLREKANKKFERKQALRDAKKLKKLEEKANSELKIVQSSVSNDLRNDQ